MADKTLIAWTSHTANFWIGCQKVSPGCAHCYAEVLTKGKMGLPGYWGPAKTSRRKEVAGVVANVRRWNKASDPNNPDKVFVGSLMDWAEDHPDANAFRARMWDTIRSADRLIFQLLTKRPQRISDLLPPFWDEIKHRIWLGTSIENNDYAYRADYIRRTPGWDDKTLQSRRLADAGFADVGAAVRFVSYEPALGPLDELDLTGLDWIIFGGESGPGYRPMNPQWARDMRDRCKLAGVAFFFKQSAAIRTEMGIELDGQVIREYPPVIALGTDRVTHAIPAPHALGDREEQAAERRRAAARKAAATVRARRQATTHSNLPQADPPQATLF